MKPGYTVRGKVEGAGVGDPVGSGQVKDKRGLDLDVIAPDGHELNSDEIIAEGLAYKTRFGFKNEAGEEVVLFEGKGASSDRFPDGHAAAGKAVPNPGYILEGAGPSAIEHSNGLRLVANFKQQDDGIYTAFGSVDGVEAHFPRGKTIGFGKAAARKGGKGHGR